MLAGLAVFYLYLTSPALAFLTAIILIASVTAFLVLRRRRRSRADRVLFEMGVRDLDTMDGIAFEHFLEALFARLGYKSEATQASGDYGVDVILVKKGRRIAVQAKHYSSPVSLSAVQEVHAGISYYNADEGWVVTNNTFTKSATDLARASNIRLIDGTELRKLVASASGTKYDRNQDQKKPAASPAHDALEDTSE